MGYAFKLFDMRKLHPRYGYGTRGVKNSTVIPSLDHCSAERQQYPWPSCMCRHAQPPQAPLGGKRLADRSKNSLGTKTVTISLALANA